MADDEAKKALDELDSRLRQAQAEKQDPLRRPGPENEEKGGPLGLAFRVSVEIVSAVAVGVAIGWLADQWLGTRPWLMLVFIVLGGAAGILNVYRMASGFGYAVGYKKDDEDEARPGKGAGRMVKPDNGSNEG
jgi:ATP synthase protein I